MALHTGVKNSVKVYQVCSFILSRCQPWPKRRLARLLREIMLFRAASKTCHVAAAQKAYPEAAAVLRRETQQQKKPPAKIAKQKPSENLLQSFVMFSFWVLLPYTLPQTLQRGHQKQGPGTVPPQVHANTWGSLVGRGCIAACPAAAKGGRKHLLPAAEKNRTTGGRKLRQEAIDNLGT